MIVEMAVSVRAWATAISCSDQPGTWMRKAGAGGAGRGRKRASRPLRGAGSSVTPISRPTSTAMTPMPRLAAARMRLRSFQPPLGSLFITTPSNCPPAANDPNR